ncbi:hypothetical protein NGRA_2989 [Nosema granulosis]|uniref:Uncharacterized protein n=1 Tax=Nosema granulosis TaxID=83296 RepID=A0A9P6GWD5_9MICR|nr:hypothetical protein NGRA_2989 [Nosema granulosis]
MSVENHYKDFWREINSKEIDDLSNKPKINETTGELVHNKIEKEKMWAQHFGDLASDHTGHSRDPEYWVDKFPIQRNVFPECDDSLTYGELRGALVATPWGKAAGIDGVSADILKLISKEEEPVTPAAKALWKKAKSLWDADDIPKSLNAGVVIYRRR